MALMWVGVAFATVAQDKIQSSTAAVSETANTHGKNNVAAVQPMPSTNVDLTQYVIGPDDQLMISVWHEPELSISVVVRPDGMITLPLVNDIHAGGLKPVELQAHLIEKMHPFVNEPQVTVVVQAIRSRKVFLTGAGIKGGVFPLSGRMSVLELIVQAGGLGPFAKSKAIYILRTVNGQQTRIQFNYKEAITGKASHEALLEPGDIVVVP
jgi:polysaccharide export outer membrane protein